MKQVLDKIEQGRNLLHHHHQHHHQPCQGRHGGLLLPSRTHQNLVEDGNNDPNRCDFENEVNLHGLKQNDGQRASGAHAQHLIATAAIRLAQLELPDAVLYPSDQRLQGKGLLLGVKPAENGAQLPQMAHAADRKLLRMPDQRRLHDPPDVRFLLRADACGAVLQQLPQLSAADLGGMLTQLLRRGETTLYLAAHQLQHPQQLPQIPILRPYALRHADAHRARGNHDQRSAKELDHS